MSEMGRCWRGEGVPYLLERDGGGGGEGRAFHIYSSKIGEVLARGGWPSGLCCLPECDDCCLSV